MRKLKFFILAILSCLLGIFSVACDKLIEFDYNIDFVVDGEVIATVGTNGDKISMPKNPTKENYTFDGWYWDDGEWEEEFTLNSILDQPIQEENHYKVYAKFKSAWYKITYYPNGGVREPVTQTVVNGRGTLLLDNPFVAPEYKEFDCWNTSKNGDGVNYQIGEEAPLENDGFELKLYAKWKWVDNVVVVDSFDNWCSYRGNTKGRVFVMEKDITLGDSAMGTPEEPFEGLFLGNGYTIDCVFAWELKSEKDDKYYGGIFGYIGKNGVIKDVHIKGRIEGEWVGSFASVNLGLIENCSSSATVKIKDDPYGFTRYDVGAAGLVASNGGTIRNCVYNGWIQTPSNIYNNFTMRTSVKLAGLCIENSYNVEWGALENSLFSGELPKHSSLLWARAEAVDPITFDLSGTTRNNYYTEESIAEARVNNKGNATNATSVIKARVMEKSFYTDVLGWNEDDWDFSQLGVNEWNEYECPKPKKVR